MLCYYFHSCLRSVIFIQLETYEACLIIMNIHDILFPNRFLTHIQIIIRLNRSSKQNKILLVDFAGGALKINDIRYPPKKRQVLTAALKYI